MKRAMMGAVLLSSLLLTACGGETTEATGTAAQAARVCTCQRGFAQDGQLLAFPAPVGCALPVNADGSFGRLAPCTSGGAPDVYNPIPGYDRPPSHTP